MAMHHLRTSCVKAALNDAICNLAEQGKVREEARKSEIKCVKLQEQIEIFQNQQTENLEFLEQERKGLEESSREWELMVIKVKEELCESRLSLKEERQRSDEHSNTSYKLRTQVSDLQDELNAVKSQSYLVMLEQEKELEAVSRVLQETWEQLMKFASDCCEKTRKFERKTIHSVNEEKKSLVCSVLTAVSTNIFKSQDTKKYFTSESNNVCINDVGVSAAVMKDDVNEFNESEDEFTLVKRVKEVQRLLLQFHKDSQTIIQRQVDEISVLQESLRKNDAEMKKLKRDLENTKEESESLKFQLTNAIKDVNEFRDRKDVLDEKCRAMMEMESENKLLKTKLHLLKEEMTNIQQDKICAEKELQNLGIRLEEIKEVFERKDDIQQISLLKVTFTELLEKKLKLEEKVDKLGRTKAKVLQENESLMQCNARLENKIRFIRGALIKAENEICRLDDIVDKFCQATKTSIQSGSISLDLMELLKVLNIVID
ncbi:myosin-11-like [Xenia sp. Carnegie-2017]|uniref:myosin-11-like n=1 Tax=Xenia sp. Carnegie-2017 TaxID=2897299 RepID=UPI001F03E5F7|nr:myosin-11-like [Xenia sp. Carnegie-2017]